MFCFAGKSVLTNRLKSVANLLLSKHQILIPTNSIDRNSIHIISCRISNHLPHRTHLEQRNVSHRTLIFNTLSIDRASIHHDTKNGSRSDEENLSFDTIPAHVDSRLSYAYGRSNRELTYISVHAYIEKKVREKPNDWAVSINDQNITKTYRELNEDINGLATGMALKLRLKRGDAVGLYSYNSYESLLVYYASNKLGLVLNPFNPSYKSHELNYVLQKSGIKCLFMPGLNSNQNAQNDHWTQFCNPELARLASKGILESRLNNIVILDGDVPETDSNQLPIRGISLNSWSDICSERPTSDVFNIMESVCPDDLYCIYYTSGTTGVPKGASITQFNAINCISLTAPRVFTQRPNHCEPIKPILCCPLPLFHAYAGIAGALLPFASPNGPLVLTGAKYNIKTVVETIQKYGCNVMYVTPTILIDLLTYVEDQQISGLSLRTIVVGGAMIIPETIRKCRKLIKDLEDLRIIYGSSENGVIATIQSCDEPEETRLETVGSPLDLTEVRVVDPSTSQIQALGQIGEIQTRGFNTMAGYLSDSERTREVITEARWYRTGDLGLMNEFGSVQLVGRIKEMIIKGGENIYPAEVEAVLLQREDIKNAQVFGVPDPRFGEEVAVWIKMDERRREEGRNNAQQLRSEIIAFCKTKLTYFKLPKYVIFVDEFPMTAVKKIKKFEMRAKTVEMFNLSEQ